MFHTLAYHSLLVLWNIFVLLWKNGLWCGMANTDRKVEDVSEEMFGRRHVEDEHAGHGNFSRRWSTDIDGAES